MSELGSHACGSLDAERAVYHTERARKETDAAKAASDRDIALHSTKGPRPPSSRSRVDGRQQHEHAMSDFRRQLEAQIPRLRRYARVLARDTARADDLVQNCLVRAIAKQHLWQPGTDLRAWLFTILHNQHVNDIRRAVREGTKVSFEEMEPVLTVKERATSALRLRDLQRAIAQLPAEQSQVILLVGLEALTYDEVASIVDIPIGTVRSRLSRGRNNLRRLMSLDPDDTTAHSRTVEDEEIMRDREFEPALSGAVLPSLE